MGRTLRFYEYTGMFRQAFGNDTRYACRKDRFNSWDKNPENFKYMLNNYNMNNYIRTDPQYFIYIEKGSYDLTLFKTVRLRLLQLVNSSDVSKILKEIVKIRLEEIDPEVLAEPQGR